MNDIKNNLKSEREWLRVLFMVLFWVCSRVASFVVSIIALVQIVFALVTRQENENLRRLGSSLSQYIAQIVNYLTYNSDDKPFPIADWPEPRDSERQPPVDDIVDAEVVTESAAQDETVEPAIEDTSAAETEADNEDQQPPKES